MSTLLAIAHWPQTNTPNHHTIKNNPHHWTPSLREPHRPQVAAHLPLGADLRALSAHGIVGERDSGWRSEEVFGHPPQLRLDPVAVLGLVEAVEGAAGQPEVQPLHPNEWRSDEDGCVFASSTVAGSKILLFNCMIDIWEEPGPSALSDTTTNLEMAVSQWNRGFSIQWRLLIGLTFVREEVNPKSNPTL